MSQSARFERIAKDLEKLPCELHESVLVDLEFEQLIRLSMYAGPRLIWSLENSPSAWGNFFRGGMGEWQTFLAVTDQARKLCFRTPNSKIDRPEIFEYPTGSLAFIHHRTSDWSSYSQRSWHAHLGKLDREGLMQHWLAGLKDIVIGSNFRWVRGYTHLIEPWIPKVEGAAVIFGKARAGQLSIEELAEFIEAYQQIRIVRAETLAAELNRLAELYEAYPRHLKEPFAPQTPRSNEKHVPFQMRCEARKLVRRARNTWWGTPQYCQYRFNYSFPPIIPYSWSLEIFNKGTYELRRPKRTEHTHITEKCEDVLENWPVWAMADGLYDHGFPAPNERNHIEDIQVAAFGKTQHPHSEVDLKWLETLLEVIAWIEGSVPETLREEAGATALKAG